MNTKIPVEYIIYLTPIGIKKTTSPIIIKNKPAILVKDGIVAIKKYIPEIINIKPVK